MVRRWPRGSLPVADDEEHVVLLVTSRRLSNDVWEHHLVKGQIGQAHFGGVFALRTCVSARLAEVRARCISGSVALTSTGRSTLRPNSLVNGIGSSVGHA